MMALIDKTKGKPVDRVAARVTSQSSIKYNDTKHINPRQLHSEVPLPIRPIPRGMQPDADLTGFKKGWLTVLGLLDHKALGRDSRSRKKRGPAWVVRCVCGKYETRLRRALINKEYKTARCESCKKVAGMKKHRAKSDGLSDREQWEF